MPKKLIEVKVGDTFTYREAGYVWTVKKVEGENIHIESEGMQEVITVSDLTTLVEMKYYIFKPCAL